MARKISQKIKDASDNMAQLFASQQYEPDDLGDEQFSSSDDNYDLIIAELDSVNNKIHSLDGNTQSQRNDTPRTTTEPINRNEWHNADELKAYFPSLSRGEITEKLCQLQQTMPEHITKLGRQMALRISALPEFAKRSGLHIATRKKSAKTKKSPQPTKAQRLKKSKSQVTDMEHVIYVIKGTNKSVAND